MQKLRITTTERVTGNTAFNSFLQALPTTFADMGQEIHHGRNILKVIDIENLGLGIKQVVVKRYRGLFWFQKLDYTFFRKPKCRKAYDNTAELRRRGFDAAEELAVVEVWNHGLFQYAFFVSEVARGKRLDALVLELQAQGRTDMVDHLIQQYAALVKGLHEHGILYWDMNCGNVMCSLDNNEDRWHFTLIDTNRVRFFEPDRVLDLDIVKGDLILVNDRLGVQPQFIEHYLRQRQMFTPERLQSLLDFKANHHKKKRALKCKMKHLNEKLKQLKEKLKRG